MKLFNLVALAGVCAAYEKNQKVIVDLYYESQCPACRAQVTGNIAKAHATKGFGKMAHINLHPYGNARETQSAEQNGQWTFQCQHGEVECQYNLMEVCALDLIKGKPSQHQAFNFIKCIEGDDTAANYQEVATKCGKEAKIDNAAAIMTCMQGPAGNALEHTQAL